MSGDVQPRKRKDKKRKKEELGVEEPHGTAAALGEGDVFMHSYHDHGTGGHWCAKIIFFSLLAILLTLIGLIILENRGLSELEANAVESRYSGVLDGWLEDAPDDDHHNEHTLELNHPVYSFKETGNKDPLPKDEDQDDDEAESDDGDDDVINGGENDSDDEENLQSKDNNDDELEESQEINDEGDDEENAEELGFYSRYFGGKTTTQNVVQNRESEENNFEDDDKSEERYNNQQHDDEINNFYGEKDEEYANDDEPNGSNDEEENYNDDNEPSNNDYEEKDDNYSENGDEFDEPTDNVDSRENEDEDEHDEDDDEHDEVEHIEKEVSEEEPLSLDLPVLPEADDDKEDSIEGDNDGSPEENNNENEDEEFLEQDADGDEDDEPIVERITAPAGKPFVEIDEDDVDSTEKPPDALEEEEEYEKKQEELRREEEEQGSNMWLKLSIGGALLAATHAVVRRATSPRDAQDLDDEEREETPSIEDRRMTLIPEDKTLVPKKIIQESTQPLQDQIKKIPFIIKSAPTPKQASLEVEEPKEDEMKQMNEKELYSADEEEEEDGVNPVKKVSIQSTDPKQSSPEPESDEEVPDDVEIINEEQIEEELAEDDEEEEISDVDDAELLTRLEAKYGRLPEPERFGPKPKGGGNSVADQWPGEPSDSYWRQQLDTAEDELNQGAWLRAVERTSEPQLSSSGRARWISARALDLMAEAKRDNALLTRAINAYIHLLKMNEGLSDQRLIDVSSIALERIRFRGNYLSAEPVYRLLIRRFPNEPVYRNNLTISFLMASRADLAERVITETLKLWPQDRVALAHYGFILKTEHNRLEEAIDAFQQALEGDSGPANEPRFYYHLGDSLLLLGRFKEAHEVHKRGAALGHFPSPGQRSLYNVERLKSRPWWDVSTSPYSRLARALEKSWREILKEGEAAQSLFEKEKEGLKERGDWTQLDLFVRGREIPGRCKQAPVTCSIIKAESGGCTRGQIKFSAMEPGTHVRPHVGPTNCRLRMHLGLSNTKDTFLRVDQETRQWQLGRVLMFDDSFEHEVWHNGTGTRLVLIVDVWHPDLTPTERRQLPPI